VRGLAVGVEDDLLGVQGAGAEVAEDDSQGAQGQDRPSGIGDDIALVVGGGLNRR